MSRYAYPFVLIGMAPNISFLPRSSVNMLIMAGKIVARQHLVNFGDYIGSFPRRSLMENDGRVLIRTLANEDRLNSIIIN